MTDLNSAEPRAWSWCRYPGTRKKQSLRCYSMRPHLIKEPRMFQDLFHVMLTDISHELDLDLPNEDVYAVEIHGDNLFYSTAHKDVVALRISKGQQQNLLRVNSFKISSTRPAEKLWYVPPANEKLSEKFVSKHQNQGMLYAHNRSELWYKQIIGDEEEETKQTRSRGASLAPPRSRQNRLSSHGLEVTGSKAKAIPFADEVTAVAFNKERRLIFVALVGIEVHVLDAHTAKPLNHVAWRHPKVPQPNYSDQILSMVAYEVPQIAGVDQSLMGSMLHKGKSSVFKLFAGFLDKQVGCFTLTLPHNMKKIKGVAKFDREIQQMAPKQAKKINMLRLTSVQEVLTKKIKEDVPAVMSFHGKSSVQWDIQKLQKRVQYQSPSTVTLLMPFGIWLFECLQLISFAFYTDFGWESNEAELVVMGLSLDFLQTESWVFYATAITSCCLATLWLVAYYFYDLKLGIGEEERDHTIGGWAKEKINKFFHMYLYIGSSLLISSIVAGLAYPFRCGWDEELQIYVHTNLEGMECYTAAHWPLMLFSLPLLPFFWFAMRVRRLSGEIHRVWTVEEEVARQKVVILKERERKKKQKQKEDKKKGPVMLAHVGDDDIDEGPTDAQLWRRALWTLLIWKRDKHASTCYHYFKSGTSKLYTTLSVFVRGSFPIAIIIMGQSPEASSITLVACVAILTLVVWRYPPFLQKETNAITLGFMAVALYCSLSAVWNVWNPSDTNTIIWLLSFGAPGVFLVSYGIGAYAHYLDSDQRFEMYYGKRAKREAESQFNLLEKTASSSTRSVSRSKSKGSGLPSSTSEPRSPITEVDVTEVARRKRPARFTRDLSLDEMEMQEIQEVQEVEEVEEVEEGMFQVAEAGDYAEGEYEADYDGADYDEAKFVQE